MWWPIWGNFDTNEVVHLKSTSEQKKKESFLRRLTCLSKREKILFKLRDTFFFIFCASGMNETSRFNLWLDRVVKESSYIQINYVSLFCVYIGNIYSSLSKFSSPSSQRDHNQFHRNSFTFV